MEILGNNISSAKLFSFALLIFNIYEVDYSATTSNGISTDTSLCSFTIAL